MFRQGVERIVKLSSDNRQLVGVEAEPDKAEKCVTHSWDGRESVQKIVYS